MNKPSLVSIIIVNYNGKTFLEKCFKSISKIDYPLFETILIDNNSTDDSIEIIKKNYPDTIIVKLEKNHGFAYPNNIGSKLAKGELLLFLNNDTEVTPGFLLELVKVFETDSQIAICQSMLLNYNNEIDSSGDFIDSVGVSYSSKKKIENLREIFSARGASMMIRKSVFKKLNGFDEKFVFIFEDVDLGWRAWIAGYKVVIMPTSIVYHKGGGTIESVKSQAMFHGWKNQIAMKITNYEVKKSIKNLILFFSIYGVRELRVWVDYKTKGHTSIKTTKHEDKIALKPNIKTLFKVFFWLICNVSYLHKKRKQISKNRILSTNQIMKRLIP